MKSYGAIGQTFCAILSIWVDAKIRVAVVSGVWIQVLIPVLPHPQPGHHQLLPHNLPLNNARCKILIKGYTTTLHKMKVCWPQENLQPCLSSASRGYRKDSWLRVVYSSQCP